MNPNAHRHLQPIDTPDAEHEPGVLARDVARGYDAFIKRRGLQEDVDFRYGIYNSNRQAARRGRPKKNKTEKKI
jgi:hypothetical protein